MLRSGINIHDISVSPCDATWRFTAAPFLQVDWWPNPSFLSVFSDFLTHLTLSCPPGGFQCSEHYRFQNHKIPSTAPIFTQHLSFPTHSRGHIMDLVFSTGLTIHHLSSLNLIASDNLAVTVEIARCQSERYSFNIKTWQRQREDR